jgi:superfamily I DNA/RNA helicase
LDDEVSSARVLDNVFPPIQRFSKIAKEFLRVPEVGKNFLAPYFTDAEIDHYYGDSVSQKDSFSNSEVAVLLSMILEVNGESTRFKDFSHVIIEEFQDLGRADLLLIRRIIQDATFTVAGDLNQTSSAMGVESIDELKDLLDIADAQEVSLELSFRVPKSVSMLAEAIRSAISRTDNKLYFSNLIENELDDDGVYYLQYGHRKSIVSCIKEFCNSVEVSGLTAVITSPDNIGRLRSQFRAAGVGYVKRLEEFEMSGIGLMVTTTIDVRGLEFDNVVVVDASAMLNDPNGRGHLFRAVTRATRKVCIVDSVMDDRLRPFVTREL